MSLPFLLFPRFYRKNPSSLKTKHQVSRFEIHFNEFCSFKNFLGIFILVAVMADLATTWKLKTVSIISRASLGFIQSAFLFSSFCSSNLWRTNFTLCSFDSSLLASWPQRKFAFWRLQITHHYDVLVTAYNLFSLSKFLALSKWEHALIHPVQQGSRRIDGSYLCGGAYSRGYRCTKFRVLYQMLLFNFVQRWLCRTATPEPPVQCG